jgi:hypothetical protein
MITDKEMIELGFEKVKHDRPKQNGVSSFDWHYSNSSLIMQNQKFDNDDYFSPCLILTNHSSATYKTTDELKELLKALFIEN